MLRLLSTCSRDRQSCCCIFYRKEIQFQLKNKDERGWRAFPRIYPTKPSAADPDAINQIFDLNSTNESKRYPGVRPFGTEILKLLLLLLVPLDLSNQKNSSGTFVPACERMLIFSFLCFCFFAGKLNDRCWRMASEVNRFHGAWNGMTGMEIWETGYFPKGQVLQISPVSYVGYISETLLDINVQASCDQYVR